MCLLYIYRIVYCWLLKIAMQTIWDTFICSSNFFSVYLLFGKTNVLNPIFKQANCMTLMQRDGYWLDETSTSSRIGNLDKAFKNAMHFQFNVPFEVSNQKQTDTLNFNAPNLLCGASLVLGFVRFIWQSQ